MSALGPVLRDILGVLAEDGLVRAGVDLLLLLGLLLLMRRVSEDGAGCFGAEVAELVLQFAFHRVERDPVVLQLRFHLHSARIVVLLDAVGPRIVTVSGLYALVAVPTSAFLAVGGSLVRVTVDAPPAVLIAGVEGGHRLAELVRGDRSGGILLVGFVAPAQQLLVFPLYLADLVVVGAVRVVLEGVVDLRKGLASERLAFCCVRPGVGREGRSGVVAGHASLDFTNKLYCLTAAYGICPQHKSLGHHLLGRAFLAEEVLSLVVAQVLARPLHVQEHAVGAPDVHQVHLARLPLRSQQRTSGDQLDRVTQRRLSSDLGQEVERLLGQLHVLLLAAGLEDLPDFVLGVVFGLDDEEAVEEVEGHAVGTE